MWVVAKVKNNCIKIFKNELSEKFDNEVTYYQPTVLCEKFFKSKLKRFKISLLKDYIFCYHKKFENKKMINQLQFLKGLNFFLGGYNVNQRDIIRFINYCKSYENTEGFIKSTFFRNSVISKAKFASGPFINMVFEILAKQKKNLRILIGNVECTVPDKKNYFYQPV